ncbi:hypothetical protein D3C85_1196320 [compost metagenome]
MPATGRQVDAVETGAAQRHQPRAAGGQAGHHRRVQPVVHERAHHLEAGGQRHGVAVEARLEKAQRKTVIMIC